MPFCNIRVFPSISYITIYTTLPELSGCKSSRFASRFYPRLVRLKIVRRKIPAGQDIDRLKIKSLVKSIYIQKLRMYALLNDYTTKQQALQHVTIPRIFFLFGLKIAAHMFTLHSYQHKNMCKKQNKGSKGCNFVINRYNKQCCYNFVTN